MVRHENWPMLLSNFLKERMKMPFEWGVNDCMTFVCKGVEALTGQDFYPPFSGYTDEESARRLLDAHGGVVGVIDRCLGPGHRNTGAAKRGDVVVIKMPGYTGGLVDDSGSKIAMVSPKGLIRLPLNSAWRIWSI